MNRAKVVRECKALFPRLRPCVVRWVCASFPEGEAWHGIYMPAALKASSRLSDTIVLNLYYGDDEDFIRGVLMHELIHCEQWTLGQNPSHGAYFQQRRVELAERTGITIPTGRP